jgi:hypothetical protein
MWQHLIVHALKPLFEVDEEIERGRITKEVTCEQCAHRYSYEMNRNCRGWTSKVFGGGYAVASARAKKKLKRALANGIDVVPCPACGWYQSNMILTARWRHWCRQRRWMLNVGACLTLGLIPVGMFATVINAANEENGRDNILWPIFLGAMALLGVLGVGLLIGKFILACLYDPNAQYLDREKQLGNAHENHFD